MFLYTEKPDKARLGYRDVWFLDFSKFPQAEMVLIKDSDLPPDINPQWEDEEPIEVNVNITKASDDEVAISKDRYKQLLQYEHEYISRQSMINSFIQNK